jgi:hypothetical protein
VRSWFQRKNKVTLTQEEIRQYLIEVVEDSAKAHDADQECEHCQAIKAFVDSRPVTAILQAATIDFLAAASVLTLYNAAASFFLCGAKWQKAHGNTAAPAFDEIAELEKMWKREEEGPK